MAMVSLEPGLDRLLSARHRTGRSSVVRSVHDVVSEQAEQGSDRADRPPSNWQRYAERWWLGVLFFSAEIQLCVKSTTLCLYFIGGNEISRHSPIAASSVGADGLAQHQPLQRPESHALHKTVRYRRSASADSKESSPNPSG